MMRMINTKITKRIPISKTRKLQVLQLKYFNLFWHSSRVEYCLLFYFAYKPVSGLCLLVMLLVIDSPSSIEFFVLVKCTIFINFLCFRLFFFILFGTLYLLCLTYSGEGKVFLPLYIFSVFIHRNRIWISSMKSFVLEIIF